MADKDSSDSSQDSTCSSSSSTLSSDSVWCDTDDNDQSCSSGDETDWPIVFPPGIPLKLILKIRPSLVDKECTTHTITLHDKKDRNDSLKTGAWEDKNESTDNALELMTEIDIRETLNGKLLKSTKRDRETISDPKYSDATPSECQLHEIVLTAKQLHILRIVSGRLSALNFPNGNMVQEPLIKLTGLELPTIHNWYRKEQDKGLWIPDNTQLGEVANECVEESAHGYYLVKTWLKLYERLNLKTAELEISWSKLSFSPSSFSIAMHAEDAIGTHLISADVFLMWTLGLKSVRANFQLLSDPQPWETLDEATQYLYRRMVAWATDEESIDLLKCIQEEEGLQNFSESLPPEKSKEFVEFVPHEFNPSHACHIHRNGTARALAKSPPPMNGNSFQLKGERGKLLILEKFPTPEFLLVQLELSHVRVGIETLLNGLLASKNLQDISLNCLAIEYQGIIITEQELFEEFEKMIHFSPLGKDALCHIFNQPQMDLQIGDLNAIGERILLFSAPRGCLISSLLRIGSTLEMLAIDGTQWFHLGTLCLNDVTLEDSVGLRNIFKKLRGLSLKDVLFETHEPPNVSPEMPPMLLQSLCRLVKFRVEETKGLHEPSIKNDAPTPHFPNTVKSLAILGYASRYFQPPHKDLEYDYVHLTKLPRFAHVNANTSFLAVTSVNMLRSALGSESRMKRESWRLKKIWVTTPTLKDRPATGKRKGPPFLAYILKQHRLPKDKTEEFAILRDTVEGPWRIKFPKREDDKVLPVGFLTDFVLDQEMSSIFHRFRV